ncbi:cellulose synthase subunit BcsC-related outer membrane protein [Tepidimonas sp.]|uniref:cellulose synthase subunit BcsC-related outer membrane protein n=1 Tax=Tepidimonas sp. TaxID=2002775 RepID=UPI002639402D|nr:cellulose synthase subunit BcsC-related outer membrane protein [Tepidimonas sp.]
MSALLARIEADSDWLETVASADLLQRLGWVLLTAGREDQAQRWFTQALTREPDNAPARRGLAQIYVRRGAGQEAYALLEPLPGAAAELRDLADALAEQARMNGEEAAEADWLRRALANADGDAIGLRERLAWNAQRRGLWAEAVALWRSLLVAEPRIEWRKALAAALQEQGEIEAAYELLHGLPQAEQQRAAMANRLAQQARAQQRYEEEYRWLVAALRDDADSADQHILLATNAEARLSNEDAAKYWARAYSLRPDDATAAALAGHLIRLNRTEELARLAAVDPGPLADEWQSWRAQQLLSQGRARSAAHVAPAGRLPELRGVLAPRISVGWAARDKSGSSGGSHLRLRHAPQLELAAPLADGWFQAELSGIGADAGMTAQSLPFGSAVLGQPAVSTRTGTHPAVQLRWSYLGGSGPEFAIGTTPAGALIPATATFELAWRETAENHAWRSALFREPVRDSALSLIGLRDPNSGQPWGRVISDGVLVDGYRRLSWTDQWSLAGQVRFARLTGRSVEDNQQAAVRVELMRTFDAAGFYFLQAGPSLGWEGYRRDLSAFTWGHGGYFSPRSFVSAGAALQFQTVSHSRWLLSGRLSAQWQSIERDSAPCHPLAAPATPTICTNAYPGERKNGLAGQVELRAVARLSDQWQVTASLGYRRGPAYRDQVFGLTLVYLLEPQTRLYADDLPKNIGALW